MFAGITKPLKLSFLRDLGKKVDDFTVEFLAMLLFLLLKRCEPPDIITKLKYDCSHRLYTS